jgi:hypothetical protein
MKCVDVLNDFPFTFSQEATLQVIISRCIRDIFVTLFMYIF